jgi:hypothetical protein
MAGSVFFKTSSTIPGQWPSGREVANTTTTRTANFPLLHLAPPPPKWLLVPRSYAVPGQWQGTYQDKLEIIGDKKGGTTSAILANKPEELDRVRDLVKVPIKLVHVIRNPFDAIATHTKRKGSTTSNSEWFQKFLRRSARSTMIDFTQSFAPLYNSISLPLQTPPPPDQQV